MRTTPDQLQQWLTEPEGKRLEFKEAKARYDFEKLLQYCVALANEGDGKIVLGVTDSQPRVVPVGMATFDEAGQHQRRSHGLRAGPATRCCLVRVLGEQAATSVTTSQLH